ncbi:hypothetical protein halTADL_2900 [Halohasta litchfieldiae]|jgi:hypothetical protein|uniref:Uncharacterized protein n=1 Tax=Halohasta litchfieldiae TaxID=1073996 RepID=A0A1H6RWX2_9EURY|nr:hypothetical protein [Halohasta litchfieldiae]ATW89605.1 hypothetical protein halTADL_2900 [Halohasta litchfieldiae]SEI55692.1 hypothetical protein SAMN05444271_102232 [Halohasta litchfieldiae]
MSDTGTPPDDSPFLAPAEATDREVPTPEEIEESTDTSVIEPVEVLLKGFVTLFTRGDEIDLETIRERTTVRNVVNYREIDKQLDPGWAVDPEIVKFGDESLADALVFSHYQRSYDVILKPVDIFVPTDEIELFIHDRRRGIRHRLVQTTPSLDRALEHTASKLTHSHFNPDAPYLASLVADEEALDVDPEAVGELDDDLRLKTD